MAEKIIRWGMIGTGNVTERKSAPSFNKIKGSRLWAVGNRTPEKAEDYARRHGISTWYRDPFDVIKDPEVDVVYIATPPGSHVDYALESIHAGKPVYIEKPMARSWEECRIINQAAEKAGVPVFVAYYRRSLDYFRKVKDLIGSGMMGKLLHVNVQQYFPARDEDYHSENLPWRVVPEDSGGGYFHDMGCHALDILFYIFGDPLEVSGKVCNVGGLYAPEDTISASLILPDKLMVTGSWSFVSPTASHKDRIEVIGESGKLEFSVFSFEPILFTNGNQEESFSTIQPEHIQMPCIRSIVSELQGTGTCPSTGKTAAVTSRVMDVISSAKSSW
ncbi:MAG: Gfo/Idh/MocA family oxidoreductase [Bacteroidota bacterium]